MKLHCTRSRLVPWALGLLLMGAILQAGRARADAKTGEGEASCAHARYVTLVAVEPFDPSLSSEVRKDLAAELSNLGLCVRAVRDHGEGELAAEISLSQPEESTISIEVDDHATGKRVVRAVNLAKIPAGGAALAVAIATDELLRASWAELMLKPRTERPLVETETSPPLPIRAPEPGRFVPRPESAPPARYGLGLFGTYTHTARAWNGFGLELRGALRPLPHALVEVGAGAFSALDVDTALGTARARGIAGSLALAGCGELGQRLSLCGGARATFAYVQFRGRHPRDAVAYKRSLPNLVLSALLQLRIALVWRLGLVAEAGLGAAALGARATDGKRTLLGSSGLVVSSALGLQVAL